MRSMSTICVPREPHDEDVKDHREEHAPGEGNYKFIALVSSEGEQESHRLVIGAQCVLQDSPDHDDLYRAVQREINRAEDGCGNRQVPKQVHQVAGDEVMGSSESSG